MRLAVRRELRRIREACAALATHVALTTVYAEMLVQVAALTERASTPRVRALEWPHARVDALVDRQTAHHTERLAAPGEVALERPLVRVRAHVLRKCAGLAEPLRTYCAHMRLVPGVGVDVPQELLALPKCAPLCRARTPSPAADVVRLARADMHIDDVLRELVVCVETIAAVNPAALVRSVSIGLGLRHGHGHGHRHRHRCRRGRLGPGNCVHRKRGYMLQMHGQEMLQEIRHAVVVRCAGFVAAVAPRALKRSIWCSPGCIFEQRQHIVPAGRHRCTPAVVLDIVRMHYLMRHRADL